MTKQFKFGDMVRHKKYGIGVISYTKEGATDFYVSVSYKSGFTARIKRKYLELIPHPDTVRLERIGRLAVEAMGMKFDLDEYRRQIDATVQ